MKYLYIFIFSLLSGGMMAQATCDAAVDICGSPGPFMATNAGNAPANAQCMIPACIGADGDFATWYTFVGDGGTYTFNTNGSDFDTQIAILSEDLVAGCFACEVGDDDGGVGTQSAATLTTVAGTTYFLIVDGFGVNTGNIVLNITDGTGVDGDGNPLSIACPNAADPCPVPPPPCMDGFAEVSTGTYCYDSGEVDILVAEACPSSPTETVCISIQVGDWEAGFDDLTFFEGAMGTGATGTDVSGPLSGDIAGTSICATTPGACLSLISNSDGSVSCVSGARPTAEFTVCESVAACPDLSAAPAGPVITTESTCPDGMTLGGGALDFSAITCPVGSTVEFSIDGGTTWGLVAPMYDQMVSVTVEVRCTCDDDGTPSPTSAPVTTTPGVCPVAAACSAMAGEALAAAPTEVCNDAANPVDAATLFDPASGGFDANGDGVVDAADPMVNTNYIAVDAAGNIVAVTAAGATTLDLSALADGETACIYQLAYTQGTLDAVTSFLDNLLCSTLCVDIPLVGTTCLGDVGYCPGVTPVELAPFLDLLNTFFGFNETQICNFIDNQILTITDPTGVIGDQMIDLVALGIDFCVDKSEVYCVTVSAAACPAMACTVDITPPAAANGCDPDGLTGFVATLDPVACVGADGDATVPTGFLYDIYIYTPGGVVGEAPAGYESSTIPAAAEFPDPFGDGNLSPVAFDLACGDAVGSIGLLNPTCEPASFTFLYFGFNYDLDTDGDLVSEYPTDCPVVRVDYTVYPSLVAVVASDDAANCGDVLFELYSAGGDPLEGFLCNTATVTCANDADPTSFTFTEVESAMGAIAIEENPDGSCNTLTGAGAACDGCVVVTACPIGTAFGTLDSPPTLTTDCDGNPILGTVTTVQFPSEFGTITGLTVGEEYCYESTDNNTGDPAYLTLYDSDMVTVLADGVSPICFTATGTDVFLQVNLNDGMCGTSTDFYTTTVQCTTCPSPECSGDLELNSLCYGDNLIDEVVAEICPDDPSGTATFDVFVWEVESGFDTADIYSGAQGSGTGGTLLAGLLDGIITGSFTSNPGECIIVVINSDGSVSCDAGSFAAGCFCGVSCDAAHGTLNIKAVPPAGN